MAKEFPCPNCGSVHFEPWHVCVTCGAEQRNYNLAQEYRCYMCGTLTITPTIAVWHPEPKFRPEPGDQPYREIYSCGKCPLPIRESYQDVAPVYSSEAAKKTAATLKAQAKADFVARQKSDGCFRCGAVGESFVMRGDIKVYTCGGPSCYVPGI